MDNGSVCKKVKDKDPTIVGNDVFIVLWIQVWGSKMYGTIFFIEGMCEGKV